MEFKAKLAAAAVALSFMAAPAHAFTLVNWTGSPTGQVWGEAWTAEHNTIAHSPLRWDQTDVNVWYRIYFEGRTDAFSEPTLPGLAAALTFRLRDVSNEGKSWTFDYHVVNASNDLGLNLVTASRVSSFSFDVSPDESTRSLVSGGFFTTLANDVNMGAGANVGVQDICIKSGQGNNCNGGGGTGILLGQAGSGGFRLNYTVAPTELVFTDPTVRFQSLSFRKPNGTLVSGASGTGVPVAWVPEPQSWALMILGFGAAGAVLRSRRRVAGSLAA